MELHVHLAAKIVWYNLHVEISSAALRLSIYIPVIFCVATRTVRASCADGPPHINHPHTDCPPSAPDDYFYLPEITSAAEHKP